jgi:uncharacterized membrane protein YccC
MKTHIAWKKLAQLGPFHWRDVAPRRAARVALGVVVPLGLGWASGHVGYGAYAALGALPAGVASFQGETRTRVAVVVAASVGMAVSTFVGATTAELAPWLLVPVVGIWGYFTGLGVALGPRFGTAVLQWSIALLIAVGLPFGPAGAALRGGLVLAGGLLQAALVAASWALRPGAHERTALAASYRALAAYAADLAAGGSEPPPPTAFPADTKLDDPNPLLPLPLRLALLDLLEEAERIRSSLAALAAHVAMASEASAKEARDDRIRNLMAGAADALNRIAAALSVARAERAALLHDFNETISRLAVPADVPWRWAGEALLGQLRGTAGIVANLEAVAARPLAQGAPLARSNGRGLGGFATAVATLRANVSTHSEAGRHAVRLAVIAVLSEVIVQATGLYQGRWVTLTIFLVLKPDYSSTLYRGVQRAAGTMLGAGLGVVALELTRLSQGRLVAAAAASVALAYALFDVSFLLFSVFLTAFVLALLDLLGTPALRTAEARLLDTVIVSALALVAYFAWPTWEGAGAQEKFARLVETHGAYAEVLLRELAHPGSVDAAQLRAIQRTARRARSDAEAATVRLLDEPAHAPLTPQVARLLIAAAARLAQAELALHALALSPDRPMNEPGAPGGIAAPVEAFGAALGTVISRLASALRSLQQPEPIPALRPIQAALADEPALRGGALVAITDRLVDAANTLDAILRQRLPQRQ